MSEHGFGFLDRGEIENFERVEKPLLDTIQNLEDRNADLGAKLHAAEKTAEQHLMSYGLAETQRKAAEALLTQYRDALEAILDEFDSPGDDRDPVVVIAREALNPNDPKPVQPHPPSESAFNPDGSPWIDNTPSEPDNECPAGGPHTLARDGDYCEECGAVALDPNEQGDA